MSSSTSTTSEWKTANACDAETRLTVNHDGENGKEITKGEGHYSIRRDRAANRHEHL